MRRLIVVLPVAVLLLLVLPLTSAVLLGAVSRSVFLLVAAIPHALAVALLLGDDAGDLPRGFALRLIAADLVLAAFGMFWAFAVAVGSLAHGPGQSEEQPLPWIVFFGGHAWLAVWIASVAKSRAFQYPAGLRRLGYALIAIALVALVVIPVAVFRARARASF